MADKSQHSNVLLAFFTLVAAIVIVSVIGFFTLGKGPEIIQGQAEATEYRVSSKVPGRILKYFVTEGDKVKAGDTLAILEVPEAEAQKRVLEATGDAAEAMSQMTDEGARQEQIRSAYALLQQAQAAEEIARKTYNRMQNLFDEGVVSGQKRDEALASYKATQAQVKAAQGQYDMARNGARRQEKLMAAKNAQAAKNAVDVVTSILKETVQVAQVEGEVSEVYPMVGELVGLGSPIISISVMKDLWGTFNIREDKLQGLGVGTTFTAYVPAFGKDIEMKVYYMKDKGSYAAWKSTKATGDYDRKTFEVRARPVTKLEGLRPGMSLIMKER